MMTTRTIVRRLGDRGYIYTSTDGVTCAGPDDQTPQVVCNSFPAPEGRQGYDFNCSACYLGHSHTEAYHALSRARYIEASRVPGQ